MKKWHSILLFGLIIGLTDNTLSQAPDTVWTRIYRDSNSVQQADEIIQLDDGGYIICMNSGNIAFADTQKILIIRTDSLGSIVGRRVVGLDDDLTHCYSVSRTTDNAFVMCGYRRIGKSLYDPIHPFLVKMTEGGDTIWTRTYDWPEDDDAMDVKQTSDGGFIITGSTRSFPPASMDWFSVYLLKTDSTGHEVWRKGYQGELSNKSSYGISVIQMKDSGYVVAARAERTDSKMDILIIRTDSQGDTLWQKMYGAPDNDYVFSLIETSNGDLIATGNSYSLASERDLFFLKLTSDGIEQWFKTVGGPENDGATSICEANGGGYIVTGWCDQSPTVKSNLYIVRTDTAGSVLWSCSFGEEYTDYGTSVRSTSEGGYIVSGYKILSSASHSGAYIIKLARDPLTNVFLNNSLLPANFLLRQNYPNPFNPTTKVSFVIGHLSFVTLKVYDVLGQEVVTLVNEKREAGRYEVELDGSKLTSGVYFYRLQTRPIDGGQANDFVQTKKFIIVK